MSDEQLYYDELLSHIQQMIDDALGGWKVDLATNTRNTLPSGPSLPAGGNTGAGYTPSSHTHPWVEITDTPTTLAGYGISDAYTKSAGDARYAVLTAGKIDAAVLPAIAISETFVVASAAAMLALSAQQGDIAVRTDLSQSFILTTNSPSTLADWQALLTPMSPVTSVAGRVGAVSLAWGDLASGVPTSLAGYGITDAYTKVASDARYAPVLVPWASVTGTPSAFAPSAHAATHHDTGSDPLRASDVGAASSGHGHGWGILTGVPATFAPSAHATSHTSVGSDQITAISIGGAPTVHQHGAADTVSGTFAAGLIPAAIARLTDITWANVVGKPNIYVPLADAVLAATWNGVAKATGTYTVNVNTLFGIPSGARAVALRCSASWAAVGGSLTLRPTGSTVGALALRAQAGGVINDVGGVVPLAGNALDVQVFTAGTTYTLISISGYWL